MFKASRFAAFVLAVAMGMAAFAAAPKASAEEMGSTCSDCPTYKAAFSVENTAHFKIKYQVRWGKNGEWKTYRREGGDRVNHVKYMGYDDDKLMPTPYLRFMKKRGTWSRAFRLDFNAVTATPGYGGKKHGRPYRYQLTFTGDFQEIDFVDSDDDES